MPNTKNKTVKTAEELYHINTISNAIYHNLDSILQENFSYTDKEGKVWTVEGLQKNPEKGTYGVTDVFAGPEYLGQPFNEVSRNMFSHFKAYCLSRGMSEEELLELSAPEMTDPVKDKLRNYKSDFMKMVFDKDLDKISDMYVNLAKEIEKDHDRFKSLSVNDPEGLRANMPLIVKYAGAQSWYSQTIDYKGKNCKESGNQMVDMVNTKLEKDGKSYNFENMAWPVLAIEGLCQAPATLHAEMFEDEAFEENPMIHMSGHMANGQIAGLREQLEASEKKGGNWLANISKSPTEFGETFGKYFQMSEEELDIKAGKFKNQYQLAEFNEFAQSDAIPNQINTIIAAIEKSGKSSFRNSDLSGKMYQQLIALKDKAAEGTAISEADMEDIKKTATEYLSYKNKEGYNKNAYGKIAAADGIIALANAIEAKDASMIKDISVDKQAVENIMDRVSEDKNMVKAYNKDKEKVKFTDLLEDEIDKNNKKEVGKVSVVAAKNLAPDSSKNK